METHNPVDESQISNIQNKLNISIPKVYINFLLHTNGVEFERGVLYDVDSIAEMYEALGFLDYAPEYIPIGNDNGDYELVMEADEDTECFGLLEQGSIGIMSPEKMQDFNSWIKKGCPFDFFNE